MWTNSGHWFLTGVVLGLMPGCPANRGGEVSGVSLSNCAICMLLWPQFLRSQVTLLGIFCILATVRPKCRRHTPPFFVLFTGDSWKLCSGAKLRPGYGLIIFLHKGNASSATKTEGIAPSVPGRALSGSKSRVLFRSAWPKADEESVPPSLVLP